ncbi:MAG: Ig-like domain-containing protein [Chryseolinea sp.]
MMKWLLVVFCLGAFNLSWAVDYYVGGAGASDNNPGTAAQPFATIQKAASIAKAGDAVIIRAGIYRETITPANSGSGGAPITFRPDNGASVVISGLNVLPEGGWTVHKGEIYKKTFTLPVNGYAPGAISTNSDILANQIFKDGDMMIEARWPDLQSKEDLFTINNKTRRYMGDFGTGVFSPTNVQDNALLQGNGFPLPSGGLVGKTIVTQGWFITDSRTITSHSGNSISWPKGIWDTTQSGNQMRKYYYLTGALEFLNIQTEFHYQDGTLYFWQPGGGTPTNVEYKARNWGFDLRDRNNIQLIGLTFKGCEPATGNGNTSNNVIDNIRASYMNHHVTHPIYVFQGHGMSQHMGTKICGPNNVVKNSEFQWSASQVLWVGANNRVENNLFHHISYSGMWGAPVTFWGNDNISNIVITKNTMYTLGRGGIDNGTAFVEGQVKNTTNNDISYNDIYDFCRLNQDGGAFYSWGYQNLAGCRFHHNWFHDLVSFRPPDGKLTDGIMAAIYFDMGSGPAVGQTPNTVDHNVFWNIGNGPGWQNTELSDLYTLPAFTYSTKGPTRIYNNTFVGNQKSYVTYQSVVADQMRNNIFSKEVNNNWGATPKDMSYNLLQGTNPQFVGGDVNTLKGLAFQIGAGSPARNTGVALPGYTDGAVGVPDIGAYEYGGAAWVAGYTPVPQTTVPNTPPAVKVTAPADKSSFAQGTAINITATATDNSAVTRVEFFAGTTKIGEDLTAPYAFSWTGAAAGNYAITAKGTDDLGATATSAAVNITVTAPTGPTVAITSPANNASVSLGTSITIDATATAPNSTVSKVEFFDGAAKLGEDTSSPYSFTWTGAAAGAHALTAKVTSAAAATATSAVVNVTVTSPSSPTVAITAPANNASVVSGTAITITATATAPNSTVAKVEFYDGATKLGEDATSPYSFTWNGAAVGAHTLTAKVTNAASATATSAIVNVTVTAASSGIPTVAITSPANNATINSGTATITANASDPDGTVKVVEFFSGTTKIGEDTSSPYSLNWTTGPAGTYNLTAKVTDDKNNTATSTVVVVKVVDPNPANALPTVSITSPANDSRFVSGSNVTVEVSANDADGTIQLVELFINGGKLDEDRLSPYAFDWTNVGEGEYTITAVVTDNAGAIVTSQPVRVVISPVGPDTEGDNVASSIPRYFTPNNDGVGDTWEWGTSGALAGANVVVFNRAGAKVYEANNYKGNWDGRSRGQQLEQGDYYYVVTLATGTEVRGAVRIIR